MRALHATHLSPIRVSWLRKIFVGSDLMVIGLIIQLLLLSGFLVTAVVFQVRFGRETRRGLPGPWRRMLGMVYGVCGLVFARSVFRVVEYVQGADRFCLLHEWTLYVFDAAPMLVVAVLFRVWWPGFVVGGVERGEEGVELNGRVKDGVSR
ncbi:Protein RTM1 [Lachnellula occidentalis]|uniref:Protein RTM1 n=1 Tax=Lachnellula occidentalis TaxID=215460 RepID=A0A8H8RGJ7_9HELO|nr:Protein RTM1 [Lachnellula occidentalis]